MKKNKSANLKPNQDPIYKHTHLSPVLAVSVSLELAMTDVVVVAVEDAVAGVEPMLDMGLREASRSCN